MESCCKIDLIVLRPQWNTNGVFVLKKKFDIFGKWALSLSRLAADEKIDAALIFVCSVCSYNQWVTLGLT